MSHLTKSRFSQDSMTSKTPGVESSSEEEKELIISTDTDDFLTKSEHEVIKVANCTYCNDKKTKSKYFLCPCSTSPKGFEPICEACAKTCHKKHNPTLEVPGATLCYCGLSNHIITNEMKEMFEKKQKDDSEVGRCFFSKFFKVVSNKGFYKYKEKVYCSVCVQYCLKINFNDEKLQFLDNDKTNNYYCSCTSSHEVNIIKLNADFFSKKNFHHHVREINFNMIFRVPKSKEMYIDTLTQELNNYMIKKNAEMNLEFFKNILVFKVLELFSIFSVYWENKFWYILPSLFAQYNIEDLFGLFSFSDIINKLDEDMVSNFTSAKFYFAELMFDYVIRTYTATYCNLLSVRTILNMNLFQRLVYIHHMKVFHCYSKNPMKKSHLDDLIFNVVDLYDNILKVNERFPQMFEKIISYVFPTFNRIVKYCIKYNIITDEVKKKYFELVYDTLQIHQEKKIGDLKDSCFYILKSVLYTIIYNNDLICYDYLQNKDTYQKRPFMFCISEESLNLTKIVLMVIEDYDRGEDLRQSMIFDYYIKKIFELLLNKEDFYLNAIKNLDKFEIKYLVHCSVINLSSVTKENEKILQTQISNVKKCLDKKYSDIITTYCEEMRKVNRRYFEFDIEQNKYFDAVNIIMDKLNNFVENEGFNVNELTISFCCYQKPPGPYTHKLNKFKTAVYFSTFFMRLEEFIHIYTASKKYSYEKELNYDKNKLSENIKKLLQLIFVLVIRDHKFLTLIMNVKPQIFAATFNDVFETLEEFLYRIIEMIYSPYNTKSHGSSHHESSFNEEIIKLTLLNKNNSETNKNLKLLDDEREEDETEENKKYLYENFSFICGVIIELIKLNQLNLARISDLMLLSRKLLKVININNLEYLNIVETFVACFHYIKKKYNENIKTYVDNLTQCIKQENPDMDSFIYSYYDFMCELYNCDAYFFNLLNNANIISLDEFDTLFMSLLQMRFQNVPVQVEYAICRYYFTTKNLLNFNIETTSTQLKNLYMKDVKNNINIMHLSKKLNEDKFFSKKVEILDLVRRLTEVFLLFDIDKLKSYENPKDLRFMFKYFENLIVRPLFTLFHYLILDIDTVKGKDVFVFYRAVFNFLKICIDFYKCPKHETKSKVSDEIVYGFEEFAVKHELSKSILEDIYTDAKSFSDNEIVYFEIMKIYKVFIRNIEKIIKRNLNNDSSLTISSTSYVSETENLEKYKKMNPYIAKREKLIELYTEMKEKNYDDNLSLIQSYKLVKEELEYDSAVPIINYLVQKLFDPLTDFNKNFMRPKEYKKLLEKNKENISQYNFQNSYILIYLNCFFYNDSEDFQNAFSSEDVIIPKNFYEFLFAHIFVGTILNEVRKVNDLDFLEENQPEPRNIGRKESLSFSTGRYAIKFIQNLCEGHNKKYQTKFFELELNKSKYLPTLKPKKTENENNSKAYSNYLRLISSGLNSSRPEDSNIPEEVHKTDEQQQTERKILTSITENIENSNTIKEKKEEESKNEDENKSRTLKEILLGKKTKTKEGEKKIFSSEDTSKETPLDAEDLKEKSLNNLRVSYFNLICYLMEIINDSLHVSSKLDSQMFKYMIKFKNFDNLNELYCRLSDLIIEMIQGTDIKNFSKFYQSNLPQEFKYFTEDGIFIENNPHKIFVFLDLTNQIKNIFFDKNLCFDALSYDMKLDIFTTMNNILSQENIDLSIVRSFTLIFPAEELLGIISIYLRGIYLSHYCRLTYIYEDFVKELSYLELNDGQLAHLKSYFKANPHIYHDKYFKLAAQMFLFLTVLAEKFNVNEAEKVMEYFQKSTVPSKVAEIKEINAQPVMEDNSTFLAKISNLISAAKNNIKMKRVKPLDHNYVNDKIITVQFFRKIIRKCEFKVDNELKVIYFICDPHYYYISKNNKETFFKEVDRKNATVKLKSLIEELDSFYSEIEYKKEVYRKSRYILFLLNINFNRVIFYNFCISMIINLVLLIFLDEKSKNINLVQNIIRIFVILQILLNLVFLFLFSKSKYGYYVLLARNKLGKNYKLTLKDKINIYLLDSFLFNDETYLMILITIMGIIGVMTEYGAFLFALQLLSVIKFVDTIKEILLAFKIRFTQLLAILGFLAILIYFYANLGFYFLIDEFNIEINGKQENFCQTLYECTVNYFNHGVRSGGGIGDLLEGKSYSDEKALYYLRFFNDLIFYITVILLLLNMINGVIVTTFSQIREESNEKEEDQQNRCYICNIDRIEFQKNKIDFADHQKYEHNINNYIKFFVYLSYIDEKDMDADQSFINDCIKERDIKFFPVNCCKSIGEVK